MLKTWLTMNQPLLGKWRQCQISKKNISKNMEFILKNKHSFILEGRYYFGIGNLFGSSKVDHFAASRGMAISVTLGYMFRLK